MPTHIPSRPLCLLLLVAALAGADAWQPQPGLAVADDGVIQAGALRLGLQHFDARWQASAAAQAVAARGGTITNSVWRQAGPWITASGASGTYAADLRSEDGWLRLRARLADAGPTQATALTTLLPTARYAGAALRVDGRELGLPADAGRPVLHATASVRQLAIPLADGWLEADGDLRLQILDQRPGGGQGFALRLHAGADGALALRLRRRPLAAGEAAPLAPLREDRLAVGDRWLALDAVPWEALPGSALDLAALTPAPVPGRLVAEGDHFALAGHPGAAVRLSGANLCFTANLPDAAWAPRIAAGLRRMGHNAVRIHHQDGLLVEAGGDGTRLDAEAVDRLDRLLAACIAEGLWITTDVYVSRRLPPGAIPELGGEPVGQDEFKALLPLLPAVLDNWKRFATAWLTHRNPYTGRSLAEEPALALLGLVNEDNLTITAGCSLLVRRLYARAFAAWTTEHPAPAGAADDEARRGAWLASLQTAALAAMRDHLRSLGVAAPLTSLNFRSDPWAMAVRDGLDVMDNHAYHDHPLFPERAWTLPYGYTQQSAVGQLLKVPTGIAHTRRLDRPFTVTEVNYPAPNHRRAEYAATLPAIAGLQGWSGVWRFAFSHQRERVQEPARVWSFELVGDPIALLGERAMALLYRRGDVQPAAWSAAVTYDAAQAVRRPASTAAPAALGALALHARIGCLPADQAQTGTIPGLRALLTLPGAGAAPAGPLPVFAADAGLPTALATAGLLDAADLPADLRSARSADRQIDCSRDGQFTVATRRSLAAVLPAGARIELGGATVANPDRDPATVVVAALDDGDLATARRLLVLHLTDAQNAGATFADATHTRLESWGDGPVLVRDGRLELDLPGAAPRATHALDLAGARRETLPPARHLALAVHRPWGPCLAWEVER